MKIFSTLAMVFALAFSVVVTDADAARRVGGGKTTGMQRQNVQPAQSPTAPGGQQAQKSQADAPVAGAAANAAAAPAKRSWMGPIAGLAAGLGLAALASHFGFGEELANMMMIALVVMAVLGVIGFIMRKRMVAQQPALAGAGMNGAQFAGMGQQAPRAPYGSGGAGAASAAVQAARIPDGFDVAALERQAKVQFIRLQAANDAGNLDDIREFTTPEMFAEIKMDISERGGATQQSDVVRVQSQVLDVVHEPARYVASVRFTGEIKDLGTQESETFDETWHLIQFHNIGVWQLAGIQQN